MASRATGVVRFISDVASDSDFFGSHQRVAEAIATTIVDNDLKIIGLLGRWGSGKSTVVRLVTNAFPAHQGRDYRVFNYDAWVHQSDPPRRAFLDQLIAFLESEGLGSRDVWRDELDLLHRRVEDTETITTPALTTAGRWLLAALFLTPLALGFANYNWYDAWTKTSAAGVARWAFPTAVAVMLSPAVIAVVLYVCWRATLNPFSRAFWRLDNWTKHRSPHGAESILSLIANRTVNTQRNKVIRTPEPSAIEFQAMFRKILKSVAAPERRLVIVVDNLDRLTDDEALSMWATIRSFFLGAVPPNEKLEAGELPTVILPIDESAAVRAQNPRIENEGGDELARSFMDKTFDVVFYVAPPVLSNWKAYLEQQLTYSFGDALESDWLFETARLYRYKADKGRPVTPRDINKTVNAIAALWLQWKPIPIPYVSIAYYAIYRNTFDRDILAAINRPVLDISDKDPDWQRSLAALHYGVPPDDAIQVLLDAPLRNAIITNDKDAFTSQLSLKGFGTALERLVDDPSFMEPDVVPNMAILLAQVERQEEPWVSFGWRRLRDHFLRANLLPPIDLESVNTATLLIDHCGPGQLQTFLSALVSTMSGLDKGTYSKDMTIAAIIGLVANRAQQAKVTLPALRLKASTTQLLDIAASLVDDSAALDLIKTGHRMENLIPPFIAQMTGGQDEILLPEKARILLATKPSSWDPLAQTVAMTIQQAGPESPKTAVSISILGALRHRADTAEALITECAKLGSLQTILNASVSRGDVEIAAQTIGLQILAGEPMSAPSGISWQSLVQANPTVPALVDRYLRDWKITAVLTLLIKQIEQDPAIMPVIQPMLRMRLEQHNLGLIPLKSIITDPDRYTIAFDEHEKGAFFDEIATYQMFRARLTEAGLQPGTIKIAAHLIASDDATANVRRAARTDLTKMLKSVSAEEWRLAVIQNAQPLQIAEDLQNALGRGLALGAQLFSALSDLMPEMIAAEQPPYLDAWLKGALLLGVTHRRTLFRNLRDHLLGMSAPPALERILTAGGISLLEDGDFKSKSDESVRHIMLPLLSVQGLSWLLAHSDQVANWLRNALPETQGVIGQTIDDLLTELTGEDKARLELLKRNLPG